jgi:hypothetical protein
MLVTDGRSGAPIDDEAMRGTVQQARALYAVQMPSEAVAETTAALGEHLRVLIPLCGQLARAMPHGPGRTRLEASVGTAEHLLTSDPAEGTMGRLVRMQLLADSVSVLLTRVCSPQEGER